MCTPKYLKIMLGRFDPPQFPPELSRRWYLADVYWSEIWLGCVCPAKYLGTCNSASPVWPPRTFLNNCYYFPSSPSWQNRRTLSNFCTLLSRSYIWVSLKCPTSLSLIRQFPCYKLTLTLEVYIHIYNSSVSVIYIYIYIYNNEYYLSVR
jgi:hypothetical protein